MDAQGKSHGLLETVADAAADTARLLRAVPVVVARARELYASSAFPRLGRMLEERGVLRRGKDRTPPPAVGVR